MKKNIFNTIKFFFFLHRFSAETKNVFRNTDTQNRSTNVNKSETSLSNTIKAITKKKKVHMFETAKY